MTKRPAPLLYAFAVAAIAALVPGIARAEADLDAVLEWFDTFDRDKDGALTVSEYRKLGSKRFIRADADRNGELSAIEYLDGFRGSDSDRERYLTQFTASDTDRSGSVSGIEFNGFGIRVIKEADLDRDGTMTRDELIAAVGGEVPGSASSTLGGAKND